MLLLLVKLWLLVLMLVAMMLNPPTQFHLLWSLFCHPLLQLLTNSMSASSTTRLPYWQESYAPCTSSARRGGHLVAALSAATPPTSSLIAPRGKSSTPPISTATTTTTGTTPTIRVMTRRSTASRTRRRRSSRRSCPEHVLP
jgi:hypothetical protein